MPIVARSSTFPDLANPNAAVAASRGISTVDKGPEILCHQPVRASSLGRPAA
jgi:hypothetical protein